MTLAAIAVALLALSEPVAAARRVAVVVGANEAAPGRTRLRYAHEDARSVADALVQVGQFAAADVLLLLDPKPAAVRFALDAQLARLDGAQESLLLFYYSGHADQQALYPRGEALPLADLKERLQSKRASVRVGIVDSCSGGGWTRAKGLHPDAPFEVQVPLALSGEGEVLVASSSGVESAHESESLRGSFFTHHLVAALRGAGASRSGVVTMSDAFAYAKELTVRDTALQTGTPQHPSFSMNLRGRSDLPLSRIEGGGDVVEWHQRVGPLQLVHLGLGQTLLEVAPGEKTLRLAVPAGRYLLRRPSGEQVYALEIELKGGGEVTLDEDGLQLVPGASSIGKGADLPARPLSGRGFPRFRLSLAAGAGLLEDPLRSRQSDGEIVSVATPRVLVRAGAFLELADWLELSLLSPGLGVHFEPVADLRFDAAANVSTPVGLPGAVGYNTFEPAVMLSAEWSRFAAHLHVSGHARLNEEGVAAGVGFDVGAFQLFVGGSVANVNWPGINETSRSISFGSVLQRGAESLPLVRYQLRDNLSADAFFSVQFMTAGANPSGALGLTFRP